MYTHIHISLYLSVSLSLSIYIYTYIYIYIHLRASVRGGALGVEVVCRRCAGGPRGTGGLTIT